MHRNDGQTPHIVKYTKKREKIETVARYRPLIKLFDLLYLRFALWWLDWNLLSNPDALKKVV